MSNNNLEPKKGDRLERPIDPDINKGNSSSYAPPKPQQPQKPKDIPTKPKN